MSLDRRLVAFSLLFAAVGAAWPHAQQLTTPDAPTFRLRTDAVVVDVVVRGDGRPVSGLTADDFEVREDGVKQAITSFAARQTQAVRVLEAGEIDESTPRLRHAGRADATIGGAGVVAIVFDRLSPEARALAHRAARQFLGHGPAAPGVVGVFAIGTSLHTVQNFTRDYRSIRRGIDLLGFNQASSFREELASTPDPQARETGADAGGAPPSGTPESPESPGSPGDLQAMQLRMLLGFEMIERDFRSSITEEALMAVITAMADVPARKSMVLLSEGLDQGPSLRGRLQNVVNAANRANVAIYAVDAAGLRTVSPLVGPGNALNAAAGGKSLARVEAVEALLMSTPAASLGRLAHDTGGAYLDRTNDLARIFTRVSEDMSSHYVLTYVSTNTRYDRRYRRIGVNVARPGVAVSARHGYYAIPPTRGFVTHAWEASAVAALETAPLPNAFPVQFERLVFPTVDPETSLVPLIVHADARHFRFEEDRQRYRAEAVFLLRIRDMNGQVLAKASDQYVLEGPADQLEASRAQAMLFYRQVSLPPGTYEVEAVVHDVQADRMSVRVGSLDVPRPVTGLPRLGSVFVVQHAQRGGLASAQTRSPLIHDGVLLYPNLTHAIQRGQVDEVTFAFSIIPMGTAVDQATVELLRGQSIVGKAQLNLNAPGSDGRIQQIASLPATGLGPGTYDLRVRVPAAGRVVTRSTRFTVTP